MLVVVAERRERHRGFARVAVAQDQKAGGRHALGQDLAAEDGRRLGLQKGVQRLQIVSRVVGMASSDIATGRSL